MANQIKSQPANFVGIQEERNFTNPILRFRKIRGRIVPIYNKKKIGEVSRSIGKNTISAGVAIGSYSIAKAIAKRKFPNFGSKFPSFAKKLPIFAYKPKGFKGKVLAKTLSAAGKSAKFVSRHSGKLGLVGIAAGIGLTSYGFHSEASSPLGYDIGAD